MPVRRRCTRLLRPSGAGRALAGCARYLSWPSLDAGDAAHRSRSRGGPAHPRRRRRRGYAFGRGGHVADVHAVGAAILDPAGQPIGAMSVSAPAERLAQTEADRYGPMVADAARRVSLGLRAYQAA
ncbi:MAG: IclR family transcriptional regulator C-terminal domain-containing protein [Aliidongia sp.]